MTERDSIVSSKEEFATLLRMLTNNDSIATKATRIRPVRRVRFCNDISKVVGPNPKDITEDDIQKLWYDGKTISNFRSNAIKLVSSLGRNSKGDDQHEITTETKRGLERWALPRQLHRHKTVQCIVSAYKKGLSSHQTMMMSQRCSSWNVEIALFQACHDYYEVHQQHSGMISPLPVELNTPPPFPFELTRIKKRTSKAERRRSGTSAESNTSDRCNSRRVRRRTA